MASMIQLFLASISVGRTPNKSFLVQPCNPNVVLNHVNYISKSKSDARELSVAAMKSSLFATKSKKNQDWRVWCSHQESPQASIGIFIIKFFHTINGHSRDDIENCLALKCVFEDVIFRIHYGRQDIADFICKLKNALGPRILIHLERDFIQVEEIAEKRWIATVPWHLELKDVSTDYNVEEFLPSMKIPSTHVTSTFEIEHSLFDDSGELYIRKIVGVNGLHQAVKFNKFNQEVDEAMNFYYTKVTDLLQLEQLRAARYFYEHSPEKSMELLIGRADDNDDTDYY